MVHGRQWLALLRHRSQPILQCAYKGKVAVDGSELNGGGAKGAGRVLIIRFRKSGTVPLTGPARTLGENLGDEQLACQNRPASGRPSLNRDVEKLLILELIAILGHIRAMAVTDYASMPCFQSCHGYRDFIRLVFSCNRSRLNAWCVRRPRPWSH